MITNLIDPYIFKIEISSSLWDKPQWGSCVIFNSHENCNYAYLLTARHNLYEKSPESDDQKSFENISNLEMILFQNENNLGKITTLNNTAYFFRHNENQKTLDIALIIIQEKPYKTQIIEFYDTDDEKHHTHFYCTGGYPSHLSQWDTDSKIGYYYIKPISNYGSHTEQFMNIDGSLNFYDAEFTDKLKGMSGSGVFLLGKNGQIALRAIIYKAIPTNKFECIKLDEILDQLNERLDELNLEQVQTTSKLLSVNNEIFNLSELAEIANIRNFIKDTSKLNTDRVKTPNDIREQAKQLNYSYHELKNNIEDLSFKYAHLALCAHDENMQIAKNRFFKKAIELNSNHITAFSLEKTENQKIKNSKDINNTQKITQKYEPLINNANTELDRVKLLKEVIEQLSYLENTQNNQIFINNFSDQLIYLYDQDRKIKPIFKYQELADFYHKIPQKYSTALYYNQLALKIIDISNNPSIYKEESEKIEKRINSLNKLTSPLSTDILSEIEEQAKLISIQEEDQTIKDLLHKLSYEISQLKETNFEQEEVARDIINSLLSLHIQNHKLISQTQDNKINVDIANQNNITIKDTADSITQLINKIPEKYQISIDEQTKYDILDTIQSPLDDFSSKIDKVTQTTDAVNEIINHAEKQLSFIKQEGIKDLEAIKSDVQKRLTAFEQQEVQISAYKNEVLDYLKASEHRMLERIEQLYLNDTAKNEAIQVVQDSISQLEKTLLNTFASESKIQNYNNFSINKKIETVLNACRNLESTVITQTNDILSYSKDIDLVKNQQNALEDSLIPQTAQALAGLTQNQELLTHIRTNQYRLEHSLLTHTQHALNNYQNIINHQTIKPPLSKSKKIFLAVYFIVMFASALYFIIRYGLLDLLLNLWHTAWQQLNG